MTVAVQRPRREEDNLSKIARGVQLASSILGLGQQIGKAFEDPDALSQKELLATQQDFEQVQPGTQGAQEFKVRGREEPVFLKRKAPSLTPAQEEQKRQFGMTFGLREKELMQKQEQSEKALASSLKKIETENRRERTKQEKTLRDEYEKAGAKETIGALKGFKKVQAAASAPNPSGADDVALVFGYMKTLDPGSTVREGEFATVEQTEGVPGRVLNLYNNLLSGQRLNPEQRQQFLVSAARQLNSQLEVQRNVDSRFMELAKRSNADIEDVINPEFENAMKAVQQILGQGGQVGLSKGTMTLPGETPAMGDGQDARDLFMNEFK